MARGFNPILDVGSTPEGPASMLMKSLLTIQDRKDQRARQARLDASLEAERQAEAELRNQQSMRDQLDHEIKLAGLAQQAELDKTRVGAAADVQQQAIKSAADQQNAQLQAATDLHTAQTQAASDANTAGIQAQGQAAAATASAPPPTEDASSGEGVAAPAPAPTPAPPAPKRNTFMIHDRSTGQSYELPLLTYQEKQKQHEEDFNRTLNEAKRMAAAKGEVTDVEIPNDPAKYGLFAGKKVPASVAVGLIKVKPEEYTLGPGQVHFVDGKPVARGPEERPAVAGAGGGTANLDSDFAPLVRLTPSGTKYISQKAAVTKAQKENLGAWAKANDVHLMMDPDAQALQELSQALGNLDAQYNDIKDKLPKQGGAVENKFHAAQNSFSAWAQTDPDLAAYKSWADNAIKILKAQAGTKGLRINQAELARALRSVPEITDTRENADKKVKNLHDSLTNIEKGLTEGGVPTAGPEASASASKPPTITSQAAYDALPVGADYLDAAGTPHKKKSK